jgi:hypothetical protein
MRRLQRISTSKVLQRDSFESNPIKHNYYEGLICGTGTNQSTKNLFTHQEWQKFFNTGGKDPFAHIFLSEGHYYEVYDLDEDWYTNNYELSFESLCANIVDSVLPEVRKTCRNLDLDKEVQTPGFRVLSVEEQVKKTGTGTGRRFSERIERMDDLKHDGSLKRARESEILPDGKKKQASNIKSWRSCLTLNREDEERVQNILTRSLRLMESQEGEEVVVQYLNAPITLRLISSLNCGIWLNDEIVNCYMNLLQAREDRLCGNDKTRKQSKFFGSFLVNKLMDCSEGEKKPQYNYKNVKR